jgi:hypothetical protein
MYHEGVESVNETGPPESPPQAISQGIQRGHAACRIDCGSKRIFRRPEYRPVDREADRIKFTGFQQRGACCGASER